MYLQLEVEYAQTLLYVASTNWYYTVYIPLKCTEIY